MDKFEISILEKLKPCVFRYDNLQLPDFDDKLHFGFIAQDLVKLFPIDKYGVVIVNQSNSKLMVNYNEFIPMIVKWQQTFLKKFNTQDQQILDLQNKIKILESDKGV